MRQKMSFGELPKEKGYLNEGEVLQIPLANRSVCSNEQEVVVLKEFRHTRG